MAGTLAQEALLRLGEDAGNPAVINGRAVEGHEGQNLEWTTRL